MGLETCPHQSENAVQTLSYLLAGLYHHRPFTVSNIFDRTLWMTLRLRTRMASVEILYEIPSQTKKVSVRASSLVMPMVCGTVAFAAIYVQVRRLVSRMAGDTKSLSRWLYLAGLWALSGLIAPFSVCLLWQFGGLMSSGYRKASAGALIVLLNVSLVLHLTALVTLSCLAWYMRHNSDRDRTDWKVCKHTQSHRIAADNIRRASIALYLHPHTISASCS